ncbi:hypothetical protein [Bifidobacterium callitrichos]|uniref:Uncharacterized protein n=1 Tax=Bifidobacterium callitrichos DSM 23973 TaxID=1437609 RepID=A0A087ACQ6_9BIFI|nr:hypothetical protein [Bifidobacterium callitrichos]KFI56556.1 hypothetical protein BCAL_0151 [Bifidobacterium callitrichos DSM 23973]
MARLSAGELRDLCGVPWNDLSESERRSVRRAKAKQYDEDLNSAAERLIEQLPRLSLDEAYTQAAQALKQAQPAHGDADASTMLDHLWREIPADRPEDDGFLADWPDDIIHLDGFNPNARWGSIAERLRTRPDRPMSVQDNLPYKTALSQRSALRCGARKGWTRGEYRVEIAPDHEHEGMYRLIAAYTGKGE